MQSRPFYRSLRFKLIAGVVAILAAMSVLFYVQYVYQRDRMFEGLQPDLGQVARASLRLSMLKRDPSETQTLVDSLSRQERVRDVVILNNAGQVRFAPGGRRVGQAMDMTDPTCQICHRLGSGVRPTRTSFTNASGERILRTVEAIANEPACQTCHNPDDRLIGVLITDFSLADLDRRLLSDLQSTFLVLFASMLAITLVLNGALNRTVVFRVERLVSAMQRLGQGDLDQRLDASGQDEFADLAKAFNRLADSLQERVALEQKVREHAAALQLQTERLSALHSIATTTSQSLALHEVLDRGLSRVIEVTRADAGEVHLVDRNSGDLRLRAHLGSPPAFLQSDAVIPMGQCICGLATHLTEPLVVEDVTRDPRATRFACQRAGYRSVMCVPLKSKGQALGVLTVHSRETRRFTSGDVEWLTAIGNQLGIALENAQLYEEMEHRVQELSKEVQYLAVLEERDRIAREMHDGLAQTLGYLNLKLKTVETLLIQGLVPQADAEVRQMETIIDEAYEDIRETISNLRRTVPSDQGLISALREYVHEFGLRDRVETEFVVVGPEDDRVLPPADGMQLVRIVQEALSNVRKHACAHRARVQFSQDSSGIEIMVEDDGRGFDAAGVARKGERHFGLDIMKERAESLGGRVWIESEIGRGTRVTVRVPKPLNVER